MKKNGTGSEVHCTISRTDARHGDVPLPAYATEGSAGMDICAAVDEDLVLRPGERFLVPTGFAIALQPEIEHTHEL